MTNLKGPKIGSGDQADVFAWKDGQVIKLFKKFDPAIHGVEFSANRVASSMGLPVPAVFGGLIEVEDRKGMVMERVDGPTMAHYMLDHPERVTECANQMAHLHVQIHESEVPASKRVELEALLRRPDVSGVLELQSMLSMFINKADDLSPDIKKNVLAILDSLPQGTAMCHGDFHAGNVIMSADGPMAIDWTLGEWGNPLADFARTWLISRTEPQGYPWPHEISRKGWQTYFARYRELAPYQDEELLQWQIVWTAASLFTNSQSKANPAQWQTRLDFVYSGLKGETHHWLD